MFLIFGKNNREELIHIDEVKRGKTDLQCPYCNNLLVAKKGTKTAHHFAHEKGESCNPSSLFGDYLKRIPLFDFLRLSLTKAKASALVEIVDIFQDNKFNTREYFKSTSDYVGYGHYMRRLNRMLDNGDWVDIEITSKSFEHLVDNGFIDITKDEYHTTKKGLAFGLQLTIKEYLQLSTKEFKSLLFELENKENDSDIETHKTLVKSFYKRLEALKLYFIKVLADEETFYKIGVTGRDFQEREKEILKFLKKHYKDVVITPLYFTDKLAFIESYFKARFHEYQFKIGSATEYFKFPNVKTFQKVRGELHQAYLTTATHQERIQKGIKNRDKIGKRGKEDSKNFLNKAKSKEIIQLIEENKLSLRKIAQKVGCSINTVRKVNDMIVSKKI